MASIPRPVFFRRLPFVLPALGVGAVVLAFAAACGGSGTGAAAPAENAATSPAGAISATVYKSPT